MAKKQPLTTPERVKHWRDLKGLTLRQLAELTGIDKSALSRIENGEQRLLEEHLRALVDAFGVTIADFYGEAAA